MLQNITEEVLRRIKSAEGDDVVAAMKEIAERALPEGAESDSDFEILVGAFGAESRTLGVLDTLAQLTEPADEKLRDSIRQVASFAEKVRDTGISHVLEVICERSHAYQDGALHLNSLVAAIVESFDGRVAIGNLNYDTLLLSALLTVCLREVADMGHGNKKVEVLVDDAVSRSVQALRTHAGDFPANRRVQLLHLHGSLTYWATEDGAISAKLPKEMLEDGSQWQSMRDGTTNVRPLVVLANRRDKAEHVARYPFALAYEMLEDGLSASDRWLIIGYSFRDAPVNAMLRERFMDLHEKPRVLVVTHGGLPRRRDVEKAFGWGREDGTSKAWLTINRTGANGVEQTSDWFDFIDD